MAKSKQPIVPINNADYHPADNFDFSKPSSNINSTPDANIFEGVDVNDYGNLIKNRDGLIFDAPSDFDNIAFQNQGAGALIAKGALRTAGSTLLKASQGFSILGSLIGETAVEGINNLTGGALEKVGVADGSWDWEDVTNNPINDFFFRIEDQMKDKMKVYKPSNWDDKSFLEQISSGAWWADEGADAAAFALSNYMPTGALGKLGLGERLAKGLLSETSLLGKASKLTEPVREMLRIDGGIISNPVKFAKSADNVIQNAFMTSNEALFEARDTGEQIKGNLLDRYNKENPQVSVESWEELPEDYKLKNKEAIGEAMRNTFLYNVGALWFSNKIELGMANKLFGKAESAGAKGFLNAGTEVGSEVTDKVASKGIRRFLDSRIGHTLKEIPKIAAVEGLWEENVQNAIQNVNVAFGTEGKTDYLLDGIDDVLKGSVENLADKEAWKSIGSGMLIGALFGGGGEFLQQGRERKRAQIQKSLINNNTNNFIDLKNSLYEREPVLDEQGQPTGETKIKVDENNQPIINPETILKYRASVALNKDLADLHDEYKNKGDEEIAEILKGEVVKNWAYAHLEAGLGEDMYLKAKNLSSYKDEELASLGVDPIQMKEGQRISRQEISNQFTEKLKQIEEDYNSVSKTVDQEVEPLRHQEVVSKLSRIRDLNKISNNLQVAKTRLQSKILSNDLTVDAINTYVSRYEALVKNAPNVQTESQERVSAYMDELKKTADEIIRLKTENAEELVSKGYQVSDDFKGITTDKTTLPEFKEHERLNDKLVQVEQATKDEKELYDAFSNYVTGKEAYENYLSRKNGQKDDADEIEELGIEEEPTPQSQFNQKEEDYNQGEELSFTDNDGKDKKGIVFEEDGKKKVRVLEEDSEGKEFLNRVDDLSNILDKKITKKSQEQRRKEVIAKRLKNKIKLKESKRDSLEKQEQKAKDFIEEKQMEAEILVEEFGKGKIRISEKELAKQIKAIEDSIKLAEKFLEDAINYKNQINEEIAQIQSISENENVEYLQEEIQSLEEELLDVEVEIEEQNVIISKLKDALAVFNKIWKTMFPNKKVTFEDYEDSLAIEGSPEEIELATKVKRGVRQNWNDPSDWASKEEEFTYNAIIEARRKGEKYKEAKEEISTNKAQQKQILDTVRELEERKAELEKKIDQTKKAIDLISLEVQGLTAKNIVPEEVSNEVEAVSQQPTQETFQRKTEAVNGFGRTAGSQVDNNGKLTESKSQKRWFKFLERFRLAGNKNKLRTVKIDDPIYGLGKEKDLFSEEPKEYQNADNIKVILVDKDGKEVLGQDKGMLYTSLFKPFNSLSETSNFTNNGKNKISEEQVQKHINEYKGFIEAVKKSDKPLFLNITGKSNGIKVKGQQIAIAKALGSKSFKVYINLNLTAGSESAPIIFDDNTEIEAAKGLVYIQDQFGRPIAVNQSKLSLRTANQFLTVLKDYAKNKNNKDYVGNLKEITDLMESVIYFQRTKPEEVTDRKRDFYFVKDSNKVRIGEALMSLEDIQSGKYDDIIRQFLLNKYHQVSAKNLNSTSRYVDIFGRTWNNYSQYLTDERADVRDTPLTTDLKEFSEDIDSPQFLSTHLKFTLNYGQTNVTNTTQGTKTTTESQRQEAEKSGKVELPFERMSDLENPTPVVETPKPAEAKKPSNPANSDSFFEDREAQMEAEFLAKEEAKRKAESKSRDIISDDIYNNFIDNNVVSDDILKTISKKIINKEKLSDRETAIFTGKTSEINKIIEDIAKPEIISNESIPLTTEDETITQTQINDLLNFKSGEGKILEQANRLISNFNRIFKTSAKVLGFENRKIKIEINKIKYEIDAEALKFGGQEILSIDKEGIAQLFESMFDSELSSEEKAEKAFLEKQRQKEEETTVEQPPVEYEDDDREEIPIDLEKKYVSEYNKADVAKELEWFKQRFPNIPFKVVKGLIDGKSFGRFLSSGRILISDIATEGTVYHEAFHTVSQLYLTSKEQKAMYDTMAKRLGEKRIEELKKKYPDKTLYRIIEEELAEEFREYVLTGGNFKTESKNIFQKIWDAIKSLLGLKEFDIQELYKNIEAGNYSRAEKVSNKFVRTEDSVFENYSEDFRKNLLDSMTYLLFNNLFGSNFSVKEVIDYSKRELNDNDDLSIEKTYDTILSQVKGAWGKWSKLTPEQAEKTKQTYWNFVTQNWNDIKKEHLEYLKQFGLNITVAEETDITDSLDETNKSKDTLGIMNANEFNPKEIMHNSVKLLITSLPKMDAEGKLVLNYLGLPAISNSKQNIAILHNELAGLSSIEQQVDKIEELALKIPEFNKLLKGLKVSSADYIPVTLNDSEFDLLMKFSQQFHKAKLDYNIVSIDEDGNSIIFDSNSDSINTLIKTRWANNLRINDVKNNTAVTDTNGLIEFKVSTIRESVNRLSKIISEEELLILARRLGIIFSNPQEIKKVDLINNLTPIYKNILLNLEKGNITEADIFSKNLQIKGFINKLIALEAKNTLDFVDNQHINPEGKTVWSVTLNDYLSLISAKLENGIIPEHLKWNEETKEGNRYTRNSKWLSKKVRVAIIEGMTEAGTTDGTNTSDLVSMDALLVQIKNTLNGTYQFFRAGDKTLEKGFKVDDLEKKSFQEFEKDIQGYLADEILTAWDFNVNGNGKGIKFYEDRAGDLRIFKNALSSKTKNRIDKLIRKKGDINSILKLIDLEVQKDDVKKDLQDFIDKKVDENIKLFLDNKILEERTEGYEAIGISQEDLKDFGIESKNMETAQAKSLVKRFTYRDFTGKIEQTKLFTGDLAFYKDPFKRFGGAVGTGKTARVGQAIDRWLNENFKRKDGKVSNGKIQSVVFDDVKASSEYKQVYIDYLKNQGYKEKYLQKLLGAYDSMDEADAQGYMTLDEYREFLKRAGEWFEGHEKAYKKAVNGEKLSQEDFFVFQPIKGQYFGPQTYNNLYVPTFYKYSLMPLIPSVTKNTQLDKLRLELESKQIGMALFASANKVGYTKPNTFYNQDGTINTNDLGTQEIDYEYLKIQLDIAPEVKDKVPFGTQFRKLILSNLMGKTLTINGNQVKGEDLVKKYNDLISRIVKVDTDNLIKDLGVERISEDEFTIKNTDRFKKLLKDETLRRNSPENVKLGLDLVFDSESKKLDILVDRNKIENILMSIIDNNVIKQKVFGDMKVQAASTGFEQQARKLKDVKKEGSAWATNLEELKFYRPTENGTLAMEVYLPHFFKEMLGQNMDIRDINDSRLLKLIGFRIPTQGLNSIENIIIKGFLPQEAGSVIITPSEIVSKAGSDYDIDKLTLFFPNYKTVYKWNKLKTDFIRFATTREQEGITLEERENVEDIVKRGDSQEILTPEEQLVYNYFKQFIKDNKNDYISDFKYIEYKEGTNDKRAIQNEIIKMSQEIVSAPENFFSFIQPNTADDIKELADEVRKVKNKNNDVEDIDNFVDVGYNLKIRKAYLLGKALVGGAALNNTSHVLGQLSNLKVKDPNVKIYLPHNSTEGQIDLSKTYDADYKEGDKKQNKNRPSIIDIISQFLNGAVDIAIDPFLVDIGFNAATADTYFYLIRAGVPLKEAVFFMNQPIISEYLRLKEENNSIFLRAQEKTSKVSKIKDDVIKEYQGGLDINKSDEITLSSYKLNMNAEFLKKQISNPQMSFQRAVLEDFLSYETQGKKLKELIKASKQDTQGTGRNLNEAQSIKDTYDTVKEEGYFENMDKMFEDTFLGAFKKATDMSLNMFSDLFVTETKESKNIIEQIKEILPYSKDPNARLKALETAKNDLISYILQNSIVDGRKLGYRLFDLFTGENSLVKRINEAKKRPELKNNLLFQELYPIIGNTTSSDKLTKKSFQNLKMFNKRLSIEDENSITKAWKEIFNIDEKLGKDLVYFSILQSGLNNSPASFLKLAPNNIYVKIADRAISDFIANPNYEGFIESFIKNNYKNSAIVQRVTNKGLTKLTKSSSKPEYVALWAFKKITAIEKSRLVAQKKKMPKELILLEYDPITKAYIHSDMKGDSYWFKEFATKYSLANDNIPDKVKERIPEAERLQQSKVITKNTIDNSNLSKETKADLTNRLRTATTKDIAEIYRIVCKG